MITFSKVRDFLIENGKRILKVDQYGAKTAKVAANYGDDSQPLKNMTAIYSPTAVNSEPVIIGYINTNQVAQEGEKRIFSQSLDGSVSFAIHLKTDGTCEIGGNIDNAVRFNALSSSLTASDNLLNAELAKIAAAIGSLGGVYTVAPVTTDISTSKIDEIKTP
jgi:glutamate/tyrosine decarboxylase-like PLP-dependent enzyme